MKVIVKQQQTNQGLTYLRETRNRPDSDIFWASSVDAFVTLKQDGLLDRAAIPKDVLSRIPGDRLLRAPASRPCSSAAWSRCRSRC